MERIDKEIEKHRFDRDFTGVIVMCDEKLRRKRNRTDVQRRLDVISSSINLSDRREALVRSVRTTASGCRNICVTSDASGIHLCPVIPATRTRSSSGRHSGLRTAVFAVILFTAITSVLMAVIGW